MLRNHTVPEMVNGKFVSCCPRRKTQPPYKQSHAELEGLVPAEQNLGAAIQLSVSLDVLEASEVCEVLQVRLQGSGGSVLGLSPPPRAGERRSSVRVLQPCEAWTALLPYIPGRRRRECVSRSQMRIYALLLGCARLLSAPFSG